MAEQLRMRWVPVVDDNGRTRMEARWEVPAMVEAMTRTTQVTTQTMAPAGASLRTSHAA